MIILKLIAWSDRPEERTDDLPDILKIIEHYFNLEYDEIVEFHYDTFPEDEIDQLLVAAEVLGRKANIYFRSIGYTVKKNSSYCRHEPWEGIRISHCKDLGQKERLGN